MNKLQAVRYEAAYAQLAQKLDMHIKNFDSDPNTAIRWVWELIQNAKDAPNIFKKTKIKQEVDDYYFVSSHNGDAFEINQLHSVVAQYSTKKEKNSELTKTTGKYGTGFITTYILSKIIELQGILKVEIDNDSDDENGKNQAEGSDDDSDDQEGSGLTSKSLLHKIRSQKQKSSKYKNNETINRLIKSELKHNILHQNHAKKWKSSHIKKKPRNRDLQKERNQLIFQKEFQKLQLEEEMEYENEMKLLEAQLGGLSTDDDLELKEFESRTNYNHHDKKPKHKNKNKSVYYYKKFSIPMDRSYTDRDEELPKKIEKTEKRLTKVVLEAEYQSTHNPDHSVRDYYMKKRTVDSFDTVFRYKITDKKKFEMIEKSISNLKELIPYALLFNDSLNYYEFIDKRKGTKGDLSFSMTKGEIAQIGTNIYLFTFLIDQDYDLVKKQFTSNKVKYFVAYFLRNKAIAAVPVNIDNNCIEILRLNPNLPKYFKDFPLIGCPDTKWNAIINSREFYPNEKRSELMLKYVDETNKTKVQANWKHLFECFGAVKDIYLFLSQHCQAGLENLLIFSSEDIPNTDKQLARERVEFKAFLVKLIQQIAQTKFIPNRIAEGDNEMTSVQPKKLVFIEMGFKNQEIYNKQRKEHYELSLKANNAFSFLYGDEVTLSSQFYKDFYDILNYKNPLREYLVKNQLVNFQSINDCLKKMQVLSFPNFCTKLKVNYKNKLDEIYSLLKNYNEFAYLNLSKKPSFDFKIILNQNNQFMRLQGEKMMFDSLPAVYHQLAQNLGLTIKNNLIHKDFQKYIKETDDKFYLDISKIENRIKDYFNYWKVKFVDEKKLTIYSLQNLKTLFKLLMTFKSIGAQTIKTVKKFEVFQKYSPYQFKTDIKDLRKCNEKVEIQLIKIFVEGFAVFFESIIRNDPALKDQINKHLSIKYLDEAEDFMKELFSDKVLGPSLGLVPMKMNWEKLFVEEQSLCKLNQNVMYPDDKDVQIYDIGYLNYNYGINKKKLSERLVHPNYPRKSLIQVPIKTYKDLYLEIITNYNKNYYVTQEKKYQILSYASQINDKFYNGVKVDNTIRQKFQAWESVIKDRLQILYNMKRDRKQFDNEKTKNFLYKLLDDKEEFKNAQLCFQHNGNKLFFTDLCQKYKLAKSDEKKEQAKSVKK